MLWIKALAADDVENDDVVRWDHDERTFAIYRTEDDEYFASDGLCTHEKVHLADGLPQHLGERPALVFAVLTELLKNAVRHSHRGGTISVRIGPDPEGRCLQFEVADEGEGISWEKQLLVRESIAAATPEGYIHGGLTEASAVLADMRGSIDFESQPAGGTRAWFTLPIEPRHPLRALRPPA